MQYTQQQRLAPEVPDEPALYSPITQWLPYRQDDTVADELTLPSKTMYLSMISCICISVSAIGTFKMSVPFRGEILAKWVI